MTQAFRAKLHASNKIPDTPPDCTDIASPCDQNVGVDLKRIIKQLYQIDFEKNHGLWTSDDGQLSASQKRMKFATWAFQAWLVVREQQHLIRSAFVKTGFLIAKDGSENHLIQVSGCRGYDFTQ